MRLCPRIRAAAAALTFSHPNYFAASLRRSAQRRLMASAMRLRPSGLSLRFAFAGLATLAAFAAVAGLALFLLPLGRPRRPLFADPETVVAVERPVRVAFIP